MAYILQRIKSPHNHAGASKGDCLFEATAGQTLWENTKLGKRLLGYMV
jgi:hypothetical protein